MTHDPAKARALYAARRAEIAKLMETASWQHRLLASSLRNRIPDELGASALKKTLAKAKKKSTDFVRAYGHNWKRNSPGWR